MTRSENLLSLAYLVIFGGLATFFALRWELAERGVSTAFPLRWWPPRQWAVTRIWQAAKATHSPRILWWGILMWILFSLNVLLLPAAFYFAYRAFHP